MSKKIIIGIIAVLAIGAWYVFSGNENPAPLVIDSADTSNPTVDRFVKHNTILHTGPNATSTSGTAVTLRESDLLGYNGMVFTSNVADVTITLPLESTLDNLLPNTGDWVDFPLINATTTAGIDLTLAANTGVRLISASTTKTILANSMGILRFVRVSASSIHAYFSNGTSF